VNIRQLGERGLISTIHRLQATPAMGYVGIGDDAAFLPPSEKGWLATSDMLVEGTHFRWQWMDPEQLGEKAVAVNVSDIAAMGGMPKVCLTSLGVDGEVDVQVIEGIYRGVARALDRYGAVLIGGDTVESSAGLVLDVTMLGEPSASGPVLRRGARPGDRLVVTGRLGAAYGGLQLLERGVRWPGTSMLERSLLTAQMAPLARVEAGVALAPLAHAMTDISDGLVSELREFSQFGSVGMRITESLLPIDQATQELAAELDARVSDWAYYGGEDYELLAAIAPSRMPEARRRLEQIGLAFCEVGVVTDEPGVIAVTAEGEILLDDARAYDPFAVSRSL